MQARKGVSDLSVHRNTRNQRRARHFRKQLVEDAKSAGVLDGLSGYAVVTWDDRWSYRCFWNKVDRKFPTSILPEYVKKCLEREFTRLDIQDVVEPEPDGSA